jgi:hypothetical protein
MTITELRQLRKVFEPYELDIYKPDKISFWCDYWECYILYYDIPKNKLRFSQDHLRLKDMVKLINLIDEHKNLLYKFWKYKKDML